MKPLLSPKEILLENILLATEHLTFSKDTAAKIVGGPKRLTNLIAAGKIEADKPSNTQNGKWYCKASQVLIHCRNMRNRN